MQVSWLLDRFALGEHHDELFQTIQNLGHQVKSVTPPLPPWTWDDVGNSFLNLFPPNSCVIACGDIDMVLRIRENPIWTPGVFADVEKYFCSYYFPSFGRWLLNHDYIMLPFGDLPRCKQLLFDTLGRNGEIFVRPDSPLKTFTGQTISWDNFEKDFAYLEFNSPERNSMMVASSPKRLIGEWRLFVANGEVVAGSQYKNELGLFTETLSPTSNIWEFAQGICDDVNFRPEPVWVLDLGMTTCETLWVVEVGGFSFAGLYECNKANLVKAVSQAAIEVHAESQLYCDR